jgi:2-dehydropantoate 2-reductase
MGKRIAIVGVGAVGGYSGAHMARAGEDVTFIDMWPAHVEEMQKNGLLITHHEGDEPFTVTVRALHLTEAQHLSKELPIDIAFVCTKSYDTHWAALLIRQYLAPGGYIVSLQNCMNEETIAGVVGWGKTMGCIASNISVGLVEPGHVHRGGVKGGAAHTVYRTGEVHGTITERAHEVCRLVSYADSAKVTDNLWGERWSKLVANTMANGVSACTGLSGAQIAQNEAIRHFQARLGSEAIRIGQARGYKLEEIDHLPPETIPRRRRLPCGAKSLRRTAPVAGRARLARSAAVDGPGYGQGPAHRDRIPERVCRARSARRSGSRRVPMGGWSTSSKRSSAAN